MVGITVGRLALFLAVLVGVGIVVVPRRFHSVASFKRAETLLVAEYRDSVFEAFAILKTILDIRSRWAHSWRVRWSRNQARVTRLSI